MRAYARYDTFHALFDLIGFLTYQNFSLELGNDALISPCCWPAGASPMLRSIPILPEDWVMTTEFGGGTGSILNDMTRTEFLSCTPFDGIRCGPFANGEEDKEAIFKERQSIERLMMLYCVLTECDAIR